MTSITLQRFKSADGIAYNQTGEGVPVVLIHGVGLRSESWYQQIEALKYNYSVFTMDMPGHGESDLLDNANPNLCDFTEKLAKFIIDVVKQPAVIVGHSLGALLSLSLAREYPELCLSVVAMNTVYKRSVDAKLAVRERALKLQQDLSNNDACAPVSRWFDGSLSKKDEVHEKLCCDWLTQANLTGYAAAYKIFAEEDGPATLSISNLKMPVLYLTGELDMNSNISMTQTMASITPKAETIIIKNSRHMTPLTHAIEVNAALMNFLQRRLPETSILH